MPTPDELAQLYAAAWLERDDAARHALLEQCCQPDVRFLQSSGDEVSGIDDLCDGIGAFQAGWPTDGTVTVEQTTPVEEHHGFGRGGFVWTFPGNQRGYGTDFVEMRDGKMATIVVFGDAGPPATA